MLSSLHLKNYILISELNLSFADGMTVITGETGAGKSILVGALNLIFGKSGTQNIAYETDKDVFAEAVFTLGKKDRDVMDFLEETGFPPDDDEVVISREVSAGGKSVSYLNGRKTSTSVLKSLHDLLIDFHHQRDQQNLLNQSFQLDLLDSYANLMPLREEFRSTLQELKDSIRQKQELEDQRERNLQLSELYRFQLDELAAANLQLGEDAALEQEFNLLSHSEEIIELADEIYQSLYEQENSLIDNLSHALTRIQKYADLSTGIIELGGKLEASLEGLQEISFELRNLKGKIASDPEKLEQVRQRLDHINNLKAKYKKPSIAELLAYTAEIGKFVSAQDDNSGKLLAITAGIDDLLAKTASQADDLTGKRSKAARLLAKDIISNIKQLSIPNAQFEIKIDKKADSEILLTDINRVYSETGQDLVEYRFSANPGSPVLSLKSIVSGGELSRLLLAAKQALAKVMPDRTMILDEIDVGIGGKTAGAMAEFIHKLAGDFQVICITHLAQIASVADQHCSIEKRTAKDKTSVSVTLLDASNRVNEIARMLSGKITELSLQHARELLRI